MLSTRGSVSDTSALKARSSNDTTESHFLNIIATTLNDYDLAQQEEEAIVAILLQITDTFNDKKYDSERQSFVCFEDIQEIVKMHYKLGCKLLEFGHKTMPSRFQYPEVVENVLEGIAKNSLRLKLFVENFYSTMIEFSRDCDTLRIRELASGICLLFSIYEKYTNDLKKCDASVFFTTEVIPALLEWQESRYIRYRHDKPSTNLQGHEWWN